jgi:hypothetical protein
VGGSTYAEGLVGLGVAVAVAVCVLVVSEAALGAGEGGSSCAGSTCCCPAGSLHRGVAADCWGTELVVVSLR